MPRVKIIVERVSTLNVYRDLPYNVSISFTRVKFTSVKQNYATVEIHLKPGSFLIFFHSHKTRLLALLGLFTERNDKFLHPLI